MAETVDKKALRDALLGRTKKFRKTLVKFDGHEIELRCPRVGERKEIVKRSSDAAGNVDNGEFLLQAIIQCAFIPNTEDRVFSAEDRQALLEEPSGSDGLVDALGEPLLAILNVDADTEKNSQSSDANPTG